MMLRLQTLVRLGLFVWVWSSHTGCETDTASETLQISGGVNAADELDGHTEANSVMQSNREPGASRPSSTMMTTRNPPELAGGTTIPETQTGMSPAISGTDDMMHDTGGRSSSSIDSGDTFNTDNARIAVLTERR